MTIHCRRQGSAASSIASHCAKLRSFPRKREPRGPDCNVAKLALGPRFRGDERLLLRRRTAYPLPASDFSRMPLSVAIGVIASGSIFKWTIDGLPVASACAKAAGKSAVFSTTAP